MIPLLWNCMMSVGGGWFFLTASEMISVNNRTYALPGIGSFVAQAAAEENLAAICWAIVTMVLVVLLIRLLLVGCYTIPSRSMESTIEPGDRVLTTKLTPKIFALKRGDVVVFHDPANWLAGESDSTLGEDYLIKRLIGLPGDVVECKGGGSPITINGVAIDETAYIKDGVQPSSFPFKVTVSENHIFVMGDNRSNSADSRYHQDDGDNGLVPIGKVVGVALVRYWPLNRLSTVSGHHDVFRDVPEGTAA